MHPFENGAKTLGTPAGQSRAPAKMRGGVRRGPTITRHYDSLPQRGAAKWLFCEKNSPVFSGFVLERHVILFNRYSHLVLLVKHNA